MLVLLIVYRSVFLDDRSQAVVHHSIRYLIIWELCEPDEMTVDQKDHSKLVRYHHQVEGSFTNDTRGLERFFAKVFKLFSCVEARLLSEHVS